MDANYNNGLFDAFRERKEAEIAVEQTQADALMAYANKPAASGSSSKTLLLIPLGIMVVGGIVAFVMLKKKK